MNTEILFSERQKFNQWWLWCLMSITFLPANGLFLYGIFEQIINGKQFGNNPMSDTALLITSGITFIITLSLLCLFICMRLDTQITENGVRVKFFPFHLKYKEYKWDEISESFVRQYHPIREYGGWGLRFGLHGKAFNVSGNQGLQLVFKNGKKLLIGTNKAIELKEVLNKLEKAN